MDALSEVFEPTLAEVDRELESSVRDIYRNIDGAGKAASNRASDLLRKKVKLMEPNEFSELRTILRPHNK